MKILLVDDTKTILMQLTIWLEALGHEVTSTQDPCQALPLYQQQQPNLVILDVMMENKSGYDCARELREADSGEHWVPIIFLSSAEKDENVQAGIDAGGDDYLIKPVSEVTLTAKIKAMQRIAEMQEQLAHANAQLQALSNTDELTQIPNRRSFNDRYQSEWNRVLRLPENIRRIAIIMFDIDHFKEYNDYYGHPEGDKCLQQVAQAIDQSLTRASDYVARYGGEEFIALVVNEDKEHLKQLAEKIQRNIAKLGIEHSKSTVASTVTLSIGIAVEVPQRGYNKDKLIERADEALYQAKQNGRNRFVILG